MNTYVIEYDERMSVDRAVTRMAEIYNDIYIYKLYIDVAASRYMTVGGETVSPTSVDVEFEINGAGYTATVDNHSFAEYQAEIVLDKYFYEGDTLEIKLVTVTQTSSGDDVTVSTAVTAGIHNGMCPGWGTLYGFFGMKWEGEHIYKWFAEKDDYPALNGVTQEHDYYSTYNLPYKYKYKAENIVNDGYPFIFKFDSGWTFAYPYGKNAQWRNAAAFAKAGGVWRMCNTMMYDERQALYQVPKLQTGWQFAQGVNGGYPFVAYDEIPFYDKGGADSGE